MISVHFKKLTALKSNKTRVMLSLGGPEIKDELFSRLVNDSETRRNFVNDTHQVFISYSNYFNFHDISGPNVIRKFNSTLKY